MSFLFLFFFGLFFLFFDFFYLSTFLIFFMLFLWFGGFGVWFGGMFFLDDFSFFLVFLSCLVFIFCFCCSMFDCWGSNFFFNFSFYLLSIFFFLVLSFSCFSMMVFYFSFEFIFVLMFFFLVNWGHSPERLLASYYMVFYTLVVSFPFLVYLVVLGFDTSKFLLFGGASGCWGGNLLIVFLVKLPVYGVHLWLPKAHVEAPVSGSMVLAAVLLKLGVYGLYRVSGFVVFFLKSSGGYFFSVGLVGGLYSCFLCLRQSDLKSFVAYSSVCHMGFGLGGFYSFNSVGLSGAIFMALSHGFCSSCLFYLLYVFYERFFTRSGLVLKGVGMLYPLVMLLSFVFFAVNMGVPPSFSFFSEVLILVGILSFNFFSVFFCSFVLFFAGVYCIFLYVISFHGTSFLEGLGMSVSLREILVFYGHFYFLLFTVFFLSSFFF